MGIEKRKAYIEFSSHKSCRITTLFKQASFKLKHGDIIDLISLEKIKTDYSPAKNPPCELFAVCTEIDDRQCANYVQIQVLAVVDLSNKATNWGYINFFQGAPQLFEGKIWTG